MVSSQATVPPRTTASRAPRSQSRRFPNLCLPRHDCDKSWPPPNPYGDAGASQFPLQYLPFCSYFLTGARPRGPRWQHQQVRRCWCRCRCCMGGSAGTTPTPSEVEVRRAAADARRTHISAPRLTRPLNFWYD
jgi:hypothetical protein